MKKTWKALKNTYRSFPISILFKSLVLWWSVSSFLLIYWYLRNASIVHSRLEEILRLLYGYPSLGILFLYTTVFSWYFYRKQKLLTLSSAPETAQPKQFQESVTSIETIKRKRKKKKNLQPYRGKEVKVRFTSPPEPKGLLIHEDEVNNVDLKVWGVEYDIEKSFKNIVGQEVAKRLLLSVVPKAYEEFKDGKRRKPVSFLLVGVTGVGKTETVKQVAKALKSRGYDFFRIDANQVKEKEQVNSFFGSARGYVGSDTVPLFVRKAVKSEGKLVILIDEVEKAHPEFIQAFMGILDEGEFTYNTTGERVELRKAFVFFTSNALAGELVKKLTSLSPLKQLLFAKEELQKVPHFPPEILGRIDYVVPFLPLTETEYKEIISRHYERVFGKRASQETVNKLFDYFIKTKVLERGVREIVRTIELLKEFPEEVEV